MEILQKNFKFMCCFVMYFTQLYTNIYSKTKTPLDSPISWGTALCTRSGFVLPCWFSKDAAYLTPIVSFDIFNKIYGSHGPVTGLNWQWPGFALVCSWASAGIMEEHLLTGWSSAETWRPSNLTTFCRVHYARSTPTECVSVCHGIFHHPVEDFLPSFCWLPLLVAILANHLISSMTTVWSALWQPSDQLCDNHLISSVTTVWSALWQPSDQLCDNRLISSVTTVWSALWQPSDQLCDNRLISSVTTVWSALWQPFILKL